MVHRNRLCIFQSLSFRNSPVGKASVKIMSEQFVFLCVLEYLVSQTASHSHTRVCHRVQHILLTQSHSQASLNDFCRCPLSLYLQCAVSEYREDEVRLKKLHFKGFNSYCHINVIENTM